MTLNPVSVPPPNPVGNRCHLLCLITSAGGDRYHNFGQIRLVKPRPSGTLLGRGLLLAPAGIVRATWPLSQSRNRTKHLAETALTSAL